MKTTFLSVSRWLFAAAAVVLLLCMFSQDPVSDADPAKVTSAVTAALDLTTMQKADNQMIRRLYGLNPADYESCVLYYPTTNMGAEELLLVKLKSTDQQGAVKDAIDTRLATQKASFDGYGVEQYDMLTTNAVIEVRGNYVLFVVNPASQAARQAFLDAL